MEKRSSIESYDRPSKLPSEGSSAARKNSFLAWTIAIRNVNKVGVFGVLCSSGQDIGMRKGKCTSSRGPNTAAEWLLYAADLGSVGRDMSGRMSIPIAATIPTVLEYQFNWLKIFSESSSLGRKCRQQLSTGSVAQNEAWGLRQWQKHAQPRVVPRPTLLWVGSHLDKAGRHEIISHVSGIVHMAGRRIARDRAGCSSIPTASTRK